MIEIPKDFTHIQFYSPQLMREYRQANECRFPRHRNVFESDEHNDYWQTFFSKGILTGVIHYTTQVLYYEGQHYQGQIYKPIKWDVYHKPVLKIW